MAYDFQSTTAGMLKTMPNLIKKDGKGAYNKDTYLYDFKNLNCIKDVKAKNYFAEKLLKEHRYVTDTFDVLMYSPDNFTTYYLKIYLKPYCIYNTQGKRKYSIITIAAMDYLKQTRQTVYEQKMTVEDHVQLTFEPDCSIVDIEI